MSRQNISRCNVVLRVVVPFGEGVVTCCAAAFRVFLPFKARLFFFTGMLDDVRTMTCLFKTLSEPRSLPVPLKYGSLEDGGMRGREERRGNDGFYLVSVC